MDSNRNEKTMSRTSITHSKTKRKTLGQIAYEATQSIWGAWDEAPNSVRSAHEVKALAVAKEVLRRARKTDTMTSTIRIEYLK